MLLLSNTTNKVTHQWIKPTDAMCTTRWRKGTVTDVHSPNNLIFGGVPRHVLDVRRIILPIENNEVMRDWMKFMKKVIFSQEEHE